MQILVCIFILLSSSCRYLCEKGYLNAIVWGTEQEEDQLTQYLIERLKKKQQRCEPLTISVCENLGYNLTFSAKKTWYTDLRLEDLPVAKCSEDMLFLFCTTFNPICFENYNDVVKPCKSVCTKVKSECKAAFEESLTEWPSEFDCDKLPEYDSDICIKPDSIVGHKKNAEGKIAIAEHSNCSPCPKPTQLERFQFDSSDYVIEAKLLSKTKTERRLKLKFKLKRIFKRGKKELVRYSNINIYTESLCLCPNLLLERRYIVMGAESKNKKTRLLINCNSTILESTPFWKKVIRQWKKSSMNSQMQMVSQRKIGFNKYWSDFKKVHPLYKDGVPFT